MSELPSTTKDAFSELAAFAKSSTPGKTTYLDPKIPEHYNVIQTMLGIAGRTKNDYPFLFNALETEKVFTGDPNTDTMNLVDAGYNASGEVLVTVVSASTGGNISKTGSIVVFDNDTEDVIATGDNSDVGSGFLQCTATSTSATTSTNLRILYAGQAIDEDDNTRYFSTTFYTQVAAGSIKVNVIDPQIQHGGNSFIWIAVGRNQATTPPQNTDYRFVEPNQVLQNPYPIIPFNGTVPLNKSINFAGITTQNVVTQLYIDDGNGGTYPSYRDANYTSDSYFTGAFHQNTTPNTMAWNFLYDTLGYANTKSIVYTPALIGFGDEIDSYFYFQFANIPYTDGSVAPTFYVCSVNTPGTQSLNCTTIPIIFFWWHCLVKGTLVTLENGTQLPIEKLNETHRVKTLKGSLAVAATVQGWRTSKKNKIYKLTTANGKSITASAAHMVFTSPDKCRAVRHLVAGDPILTESGPSTVAFIEQINHENLFYGLALGNPAELASPGFPTNLAGYYAGGILNGDQFTVRHHIKEANHDLNFILPKINPALHVDYASAIRDKRF